jgi:pre-mRNA-splicing helicase BRR2
MQLPVESQLVGTLANNLNAEIVLGTVQNIEDAAAWLGYTYFYVRMLCEPQLYGVPLDAADSDPVLQVCSYFYSISWQIHVWDMKITLVYVFTFM